VDAVASNYFRIRARLPTPDFGLSDPTLTHTLPEIARVVGLTLSSPDKVFEALIPDP
jgi:hypothetical protein